jgi:hypothetical protein
MSNISQSLNKLKDKVNLDGVNEEATRYNTRQQSLKSKVQESGHTLDMTKTVSTFYLMLLESKKIKKRFYF